MTELYKRVCSLVVGNAVGSGIDLSAFRVKFSVKQSLVQTPKFADITVYNLGHETALQIQQEFKTVELRAGYEGAVGLIFRGTVIQARIGRESATDNYLQVIATHQDLAHNFTVTSKSIAAGWTQADRAAAIAGDFARQGVTLGSVPNFSSAQAPRGRVCFGMTRDQARQLADANGAHWNIDDDQLQMCRIDETLPDVAVVLNSKTGMIGMPALTIDGVVVRSLLRSDIRAGQRLQIDNASIQDPSVPPSISYAVERSLFPTKDADGLYKVYYVSHTGDTRGQPWYTDMIATSMASIPAFSDIYVNAVASNGS